MLFLFAGIAVHTLTDLAIERQRKTKRDEADNMMAYLVKQMGRFLLGLSRDATNTEQKFKRFWLAIYGNYLITLYLLIKLVYVANAFGQIYVINAFLGSRDFHSGFTMYGYEVLWRLFHGESWTTSDRFPRVTLCDFKLRVLGSVNRYTVQCALPMNLLNEIFFIFIWFWLVAVGLSTLASFLLWFFRSLFMGCHVRYIRNRLTAMGKDKTKISLDKFVSDYLRRDGCFIVRLISNNTSGHIANELVVGLFDHYKENRRGIDKRLHDAVDKHDDVEKHGDREHVALHSNESSNAHLTESNESKLA